MFLITRYVNIASNSLSWLTNNEITFLLELAKF